ncbi:MAG: hypothetical protein PHF20_01400 [Halothiobacillaceae bacterium]|nr:hypothetical protein [Halothiobacillaceae bacterium]
MYSPSNLSSAEHLEKYLRLAEAARKDQSLVPNHVACKVPAWLQAHKAESHMLLKEIAGKGDDEFEGRLNANIERVANALTAYSSD